MMSRRKAFAGVLPAPIMSGALTEKSMNVQRLLDFIGSIEAAGNYNAVYGNAKSRDDLSRHTLDEVIALPYIRLSGSFFSARGKYQFLRNTLKDIKQRMGLTGREQFTPTLQDRMATNLLKLRGLDDWAEGRLTDEEFADSIAREWASLPVVTAQQGAHRWVTPGQSYYAGDAVNRALTTPDRVLACLAEVRAANPLRTKPPADLPDDCCDPCDLPVIRGEDTGAAVRVLQRTLNSAFLVEVDGVFGSRTEAVVRLFQRAHGLDDDAIVGEKTWQALKDSNPQGGAA